MIFYATKETMNGYDLKTPEQMRSEMALAAKLVVQRERGNRMYEWGCKQFSFDGRQSLQLMHFETKLVVFLIDLKQEDIEHAGAAVANYLLDMYASDQEMLEALNRFFASSPVVCFDKITDRSIIASMNHVQRQFAMDGVFFYRYIHDHILHTKQINRDVNQIPVKYKVDGVEEWLLPYELFAETIKRKFGRKSVSNCLS